MNPSILIFTVFLFTYAAEGGIIQSRTMLNGSDVENATKVDVQEKMMMMGRKELELPEILDETNSSILANLSMEDDFGNGRAKRQMKNGPLMPQVKQSLDLEAKMQAIHKLFEHKEMHAKCMEFVDSIVEYFGNDEEKISDTFETNEEYMNEAKRICKLSMDLLIDASKIGEFEMIQMANERVAKDFERIEKALDVME